MARDVKDDLCVVCALREAHAEADLSLEDMPEEPPSNVPFNESGMCVRCYGKNDGKVKRVKGENHV